MKLLPNSIVGDKAFALSVKMVKAARRLMHDEGEYELGRQLLRSGTSIGANITEAQGGISRADFSAKISIAYREALETKYWLNLLYQTQLLAEDEFNQLLWETDDVSRMLFKILKKMGRIRDQYSLKVEEDTTEYLNLPKWLSEEEENH